MSFTSSPLSLFCLQLFFFFSTWKSYVLFETYLKCLLCHEFSPNSFSWSCSLPFMILEVGIHASSEHWPGYTRYDTDYGAGITHVTSCGMLRISVLANCCVVFKHWSPETGLMCGSGQCSVYWLLHLSVPTLTITPPMPRAWHAAQQA